MTLAGVIHVAGMFLLKSVKNDAQNDAEQLGVFLNERIGVKIYMDSRLLLETLGSISQVAEKALRQLVTYLKQSLKKEETMDYSWIEGEEIGADVFTKQESARDALEEIVKRNKFRHAKTRDNLLVFENDEFKVRNLVTKREKQQKQQE